jgi:hypothetical protein
MSIQDPSTLYQLLLQQQVAEAYLEGIDLRNPTALRTALRREQPRGLR